MKGEDSQLFECPQVLPAGQTLAGPLWGAVRKAEKDGTGLWADKKPVPPWEWR